MQTIAPQEELQTVGTQLQAFLDLPLGIRCRLQEENLVVIGQHSANTSIDPKQTLKFLERKIQSLQLKFAQQVRLYLQVVGEKYPYAYRYFKIQPPAPPPNPDFCGEVEVKPVQTKRKEDEWVVPDDELDALMHELMAPVYDRLDPSYEELELIPLEYPDDDQDEPGGALALLPPSAIEPFTPTSAASGSWVSKLNGKVVLTTGVAALGIVGGAYALTRPCVVGSCAAIQDAQALSQQSVDVVQDANDSSDLRLARQHLGQAIATLETIPMWSGRSDDAQELVSQYESQARFLDEIITVENMAIAAAEKAENSPRRVEDWQEIRELWRTSINQLEKVPPQSGFYPFAQEKLQTYRANLEETDRQLEREQQSQHQLDLAKQAIALVEARRQIAQSATSLELVRSSWEVAIERLQAVPDGTIAAIEARRLLTAYQPQITQANGQVEQEQETAKVFERASQQAQQARLAQQQANWQRAIASWNSAIIYSKQIPANSIYRTQADALISASKTAIAEAQQKLQVANQVSSQLDRVCKNELRACNLVSVNAAIRVQLDSTYVQTIESVRDSGNSDLKAIVHQHQLSLKRSLEGIANRFQLPVEVYDPANIMLDRHMPG